MNRVVFFPFHPDLRLLMKYKGALLDTEIGGFVSYKEDAELIESLNKSLGFGNLSYSQMLHDCDAVILLDNFRDCSFDKYYQVITDAYRLKKKVIVTPLIESQLSLKSNKGRYHLLERLPDNMSVIDKEYDTRLGNPENKLYEINTPIIGVVGQGKHCDKFTVQLMLMNMLKEEYNAVAVTSNALGALFGFYTIPAFMYKDIPFLEKILKFNYFINKISRTDTPDVIVLGVPEGIVPFRRHEFHNFAEYPLVVSSSVDIDFAILCTYFLHGGKLERGLNAFVDFCQNKFNIPVGAVAISRVFPDIPDEDNQELTFEYLSDYYFLKNYPDVSGMKIPMINILNQEDAVTALKRSLLFLQDNALTV